MKSKKEQMEDLAIVVIGDTQTEFLRRKNEALPKIKAKIAEAVSALNEAEKISEKYGIPFYSDISMLGQQYVPEAYIKVFNELDARVTGVFPDAYGEKRQDGGWEHSAIC